MELKEYKLGDIAEISTGYPFDGNLYAKEGIRVLRGENIGDGILKWDDRIDKRWNAPFSKSDVYTLCDGDIVMQMDGNVGRNKSRVFAHDLPMLIAQRVGCIRAKKEIADQDFLYYVICSERYLRYINKVKTGTSIHHISLSQISNYTLSIPPLITQKRIADVLSSFDKQIALNKQINQNLEALARQLYDYWFVQFDFPDANGKPYKSSGGKMVYNPILKREIPEGWEVKKLGELCSINKRTSNGRYNSPILYLDTASITNNNIEMLQFLDPEKDEIPSRARRVVMEGDIVYSTVRPNLRHFGLLYDPKSNMVVSTGFAVITANWSAFRYYIYQFLKQDKVVDNLHSIAQSAVSSYPSINASDIQNLDIVVPSNIQIDAFAHIACKIHAQLEIHAQQILSLTKQRDELLPLLMNGQVNFDLSDD